MEVTGLLLGAVGLIVPTYQAVQSLTNRIAATKNFPRKLRTLNAQISLQKKLFDNECILLFSSDFDEALIREMLSNEGHPMWEDRDFQEKFKAHLGAFFDESVLPFAIIRGTIEELEKEITKVTVTADKDQKLAGSIKNMYKKLHRPSETPNLDALLTLLRAQLGDLLNLRRQREASQKRRYRATEPKPVLASKAPVAIDRMPQVTEVQKTAKRVFAAMASVVNCTCHRFYFQLQCESEKEAEIERLENGKRMEVQNTSFKLFLTPSGVEEKVSCTCLSVRTDPGAPTPTSTPAPPPYTKLPPKEAATVMKPKKKLQFVYETDGSAASLSETLTDLCSSISSLTSPINTPSYLGALPSTDAHRHIYTEFQKPSVSRISLPRVFERAPLSRTRSILPPTRRYRLAWILSASLLRFGFYTTNWFRENWRTGDIYFMQDGDSSAALDFPHISVHFNPSTSKPAYNTGTCLAKNEQLYSLAIALIEIGYGDTLKNLCMEGEKGEAAEKEWNHAREYAGAQGLAKTIDRVMGRRYGLVVRRCFYCNFAIDEEDLTPARLQRAFYEKVECELRGCMVEFSG